MNYIWKKNIYTAVLFICIICPTNAYPINKQSFEYKHAITHKPCKTRFGDQLCGYSRAKWLSYKYKLPFLFIPFEYSEDLTMFYAEEHANEELTEFIRKLVKNPTEKMPSNKLFSKNIIVEKESQLGKALKDAECPTLFICKFQTSLDRSFIDLGKEIIRNRSVQRYTGNYERVSNFNNSLDLQTYLLSLHAPFGSILKKMLTPINQININIPKDIVTVAVHVRAGSGHDQKRISQQYYNSKDYQNKNGSTSKYYNISDYPRFKAPIDVAYPSKFPPNQYFIDQIVILSKILGNIPMYVHIFTDEMDTFALMSEFKRRVNLPNIIWGCRTDGNFGDYNVVEDFYVMSKFDYLIRPASSYSLSASLLGSHKIIISPKHARWVSKEVLLIDEIEIDYRDNIINTINSTNNKVN